MRAPCSVANSITSRDWSSGGRSLLALDRALVEERALEREDRAHLREHVGRHGGLDVARQARTDAGVERLLDRRRAVTHGHLDRAGDGERAAGVLDPPHLRHSLALVKWM